MLTMAVFHQNYTPTSPGGACHLIFVRNSDADSFFNFTCSRIPVSQERLYMKLVTVSQMQAIEKEADAGDLSYDQMMENAGQGLADIVLEIFEGEIESEAVGLVGPGNNGGDTLGALDAVVGGGWAT